MTSTAKYDYPQLLGAETYNTRIIERGTLVHFYENKESKR